MRINKLEIKNFKFFNEVEALNFESKNILLYGENGSGKSTIYWALYTLLQSSKKDDNKIKKYFTHSTDAIPNKHSLVNIYAGENDSKIELFVNEDRDKLIISKNEITIKDDTKLIEDTLATSDFISYKYLFRFFNFSHNDEIDLFELFEYEILHLVGLNELWQEIIDLEENKPKRTKADKTDYESLKNKLNEFNNKLKDIISDINEPTKNYVERFNYTNIKIILSIEDGKYRSQTLTKPKIKVALSIIKEGEDDITILRPQSYFNEAKLTAIALSVRLAITEIKLKNSPLKLLVLDDLLVSLDMSNRDKVLDILLNDEVLKEYQKIILTHDKAFFEMAKQKFNYVEKGDWKYFEMYLDIEGDIEKPLLKTYQTYHEKAIEYFDQREYEVASNFLRKEVEKQLYDYLGLKSLEGMIDTAKIKDNYKKLDNCFAPLIIALKGFDNCENIHDDNKVEKCIEFADKVKKALISLENIFKENNFHDINSIKDRILNPQAHYDITKPLYKKELEDAIELIKAFDNILNEEFQ